MIVISFKQRNLGLFLSATLGVTLAGSLQPGIHSIFSQFLKLNFFNPLTNSPLVEMALFALVSLLFYLSIPRSSRNTEVSTASLSSLAPSFAIPVIIALAFGWVLNRTSLVSSQNRLQDLFWFVFCIPMGEELLFRGWLWAIFRSLFKNSLFTLTNPLPSALIFSSFSFSLWHLQNSQHISPPFLAFQVVYTFFTGVWLGYLRWRTGKITSSILAHALINLAASLPGLL